MTMKMKELRAQATNHEERYGRNINQELEFSFDEH